MLSIKTDSEQLLFCTSPLTKTSCDLLSDFGIRVVSTDDLKETSFREKVVAQLREDGFEIQDSKAILNQIPPHERVTGSFKTLIKDVTGMSFEALSGSMIQNQGHHLNVNGGGVHCLALDVPVLGAK